MACHTGRRFTHERLGRAGARLRRTELDDVDSGERAALQPPVEFLGERLDLR